MFIQSTIFSPWCQVVFGEGGGGLTNVIPGKKEELCFFVSNAEKKSLWLKLEVKAKSHGHGSVPSSKTADKIFELGKEEHTPLSVLQMVHYNAFKILMKN